MRPTLVAPTDRRKEEKANGASRFEIEIVNEMLFSLSRDRRLIGYVVTATSRNGLDEILGGDFARGNRLFFNERGFLVDDRLLTDDEVGP